MRTELIDLGEARTVQLLGRDVTMKAANRLASSINMVRALGVEAPEIQSVVEKDGRAGLVFDMPSGVTFAEWMRSSMYHWNRMVSLFAHEVHEVHLHIAPDLDGVKEGVAARLPRSGLPEDQVAKLLESLRKLPDGEYVCNWNYIPENIIVSYDGPKAMIWDGLRCGPYLADVARTIVLLKVSGEDVMADAFRKEYMKICGKSDDELDSWLPIIAADRLADGLADEADALGKIIRMYLGSV